jgi:hypothetical protein
MLLLVFSVASIAAAQDKEKPKFEVFGGYSFVSTDLLEIGIVPGSRRGAHGWNTQFTWNFSHDVGLTADFSGHYGSQNINFGTPIPKTEFDIHAFLFGPKFTHKTGNFEMYAQTQVGMIRGTIRAPAAILPPGSPTSFKDADFGLGLGGGVDYFREDSRFGYRVVEVKYMMSQVLGSLENNIRVSTGVIIRW